MKTSNTEKRNVQGKKKSKIQKETQTGNCNKRKEVTEEKLSRCNEVRNTEPWEAKMGVEKNVMSSKADAKDVKVKAADLNDEKGNVSYGYMRTKVKIVKGKVQ